MTALSQAKDPRRLLNHLHMLGRLSGTDHCIFSWPGPLMKTLAVSSEGSRIAVTLALKTEPSRETHEPDSDRAQHERTE